MQLFLRQPVDIASIHESGCGYFYVKMEKGNVYASMTLPNLVIGTVGGGTSLPWQKESLDILDCYGQGKVNRLAEIIAGFCLALDISTMSAMVTDVFASAHERLARNPTKLKILKERKYSQ